MALVARGHESKTRLGERAIPSTGPVLEIAGSFQHDAPETGGRNRCRGRGLRRLGAPPTLALGATFPEPYGPYPSADLVPDGERAATMAVTIDATPDQVWPWLVQMGGDRGGWYSWDRLDNGGRPSATWVHPEWQDLAVGDHVKYWLPSGPVDAWEVAALEPNRFLGLRGLTDLRGRMLDPKQPRPSSYVEGLWGFLLTEVPGGRTRLVIIGYQAIRPRVLGRFVFYWFYVPVTWVMQARMLVVLKRNIEPRCPAAGARSDALVRREGFLVECLEQIGAAFARYVLVTHRVVQHDTVTPLLLGQHQRTVGPAQGAELLARLGFGDAEADRELRESANRDGGVELGLHRVQRPGRRPPPSSRGRRWRTPHRRGGDRRRSPARSRAGLGRTAAGHGHPSRARRCR